MTMVRVRTYLATENYELVPIEEFAGRIPNRDYVGGSIEIIVDHRPVKPKDNGDCLNDEWPSLISATLELVRGREGTCYVADCGETVTFKPIRAGRDVLITHGSRADTLTGKITSRPGACADFRELCHNIVTAGYIYCEHIMRLIGNRCVQERRELAEIEAEFHRRASDG